MSSTSFCFPVARGGLKPLGLLLCWPSPPCLPCRVRGHELGPCASVLSFGGRVLCLGEAVHGPLKKVYYQHWRLTNGEGEEVELRPDAQTGLLLFEVPPGRHELTLDRRILPVETLGMLLSLLTLFGVLAGLGALRTQKRPA